MVGPQPEEVEPAARPGLGRWRLTSRRLRRDRVALAAGAVFVLLLAACLAAPLWAKHVAETTPEENHISDQVTIDGVPCDVVCTGRFYDFLEKRDRWGIVRRQPVYEKDRMDPVDPAASLTLDPERLGRFPEGYRHLAYLQSSIGFDVKGNLPGLRGAAARPGSAAAPFAAPRPWVRRRACSRRGPRQGSRRS